MAEDTNTRWLTQEAYDRLKKELDDLKANRPVIAAEINERREEGDLKENGGYHAAREQQGQEEARIAYLEELLDSATIGEAPSQSGVALVGSVVHVYYDGDEDDTETFLIGTRGVHSLYRRPARRGYRRSERGRNSRIPDSQWFDGFGHDRQGRAIRRVEEVILYRVFNRDTKSPP